MKQRIRFLCTVFFRILCITLILFLASSCIHSTFVDEFSHIAKGDRFSLARWQAGSVAHSLLNSTDIRGTEEEQSRFVLEYIEAAQRELALSDKELGEGLSEEEYAELHALRKQLGKNGPTARAILARQIKEIMRDEGIINPWDKTGIFFPPVNFRITKPPKVLIIAHRDKLEERTRIFLHPDLSLEKIEAIEKQAEDMGYSAYVTGLGGVGAYPAIVAPRSPKRTMEIVVHEWLHNYIVFTPLGGIVSTTEKRVLEETAVSIMDKEIAEKLWNKYYVSVAEAKTSYGDETPSYVYASQPVDFGEAMREIRLQVESYLLEGRVEEAEEYMAQKRDWLEQEGHYVRKLNQAYLTFHGFYATGTAYKDANGGAGAKLLELRQSSATLKEFLGKITRITSFEDLDKALKK